MKPNQLLSLLCATVFLFNCKGRNTANDSQKPVSKMRIEIIDPEALKILDSTASIEVMAEGFKWTEGPLYITDGDYFIFSDIPENKIRIAGRRLSIVRALHKTPRSPICDKCI